MAILPTFQTGDRDFSLMQSRWAAILNPRLAAPQANSSLLTGVALANGVTVVNHKLGRKLQGWKITDIDGAATIYRSAPTDDLTLTLTSNAAVTVSLEVF